MTRHLPTAMIALFHDILDKDRKQVFAKLAAFSKVNAVLGGGTALALQLGHRRSFDFDMFLPKPIPRLLYRLVENVFGESPVKSIESGDQLTLTLSSQVELTFLYYWYPALYPTITTNSLPLFDKRDIASDKAFTLGRRNVWRDYVDFFFLLNDKHTTLKKIIDDAVKRFGNEFSPKLFLGQLSYTKDIRDFNVAYMDKIYNPAEIQRLLASEVKLFFEKEIENTK